MNMKKPSKFSAFYIGLILFLMYLPIIVVVVYSFNDTKFLHWEGFTLDWYTALFNNKAIMRGLKSSIEIAVISCTFACIIGTLGAIGMSKSYFKGRGSLEDLALMPIMIPEIILGMAYLAFFSFIRFPLGMTSIILSHITFCVPYIYINVKASLAIMDPSLVEAASDLGASEARSFFDITLPIIAPAVLSGTLLAFAMSMDDVVISFFTTGPGTTTLPIHVYSMLKTGVTPEINALSTIMLATVFTAVAIAHLIKNKRKIGYKK